MVYDNKSNTFTIGQNSDSPQDSGVFFVNMLKTISQQPTASKRQVDDWKTIEHWLDCGGRDLTQQDNEKIGKAWKAYIAMGIAPTVSLQPSFDYFSKEYESDGYSFDADKPPKEIVEVFARLIASNKDIDFKKKHDEYSKHKNYYDVRQNFLSHLSGEKRSLGYRLKDYIFSIIKTWR